MFSRNQKFHPRNFQTKWWLHFIFTRHAKCFTQQVHSIFDILKTISSRKTPSCKICLYCRHFLSVRPNYPYMFSATFNTRVKKLHFFLLELGFEIFYFFHELSWRSPLLHAWEVKSRVAKTTGFFFFFHNSGLPYYCKPFNQATWGIFHGRTSIGLKIDEAIMSIETSTCL